MSLSSSTFGVRSKLITNASKRFLCDDKSWKARRYLEERFNSKRRELEDARSKLANIGKAYPDVDNPTEESGLSTPKKLYLVQERDKKEIGQLKDEKKGLSETLSSVEKEFNALKITCFEKVKNGEEVVIMKSTMSKEMEMDAAFSAVRALHNEEDYLSRVAARICGEFDKKYGLKWHCFVIAKEHNDPDDERDFGWSVEKTTNNYIDFLVDSKDDEGKRILLFKPTLSASENEADC